MQAAAWRRSRLLSDAVAAWVSFGKAAQQHQEAQQKGERLHSNLLQRKGLLAWWRFAARSAHRHAKGAGCRLSAGPQAPVPPLLCVVRGLKCNDQFGALPRCSTKGLAVAH